MKMKFVRQEKGTKNKGNLPLDPLAGNGTKKAEYPEIDEYYIYSPKPCLLYTSPSPRDGSISRMPSSA